MTTEEAEIVHRMIVEAGELSTTMYLSLRRTPEDMKRFAEAIEKASDLLTLQGFYCPECSGDGGKNGGCGTCHGSGRSKP